MNPHTPTTLPADAAQARPATPSTTKSASQRTARTLAKSAAKPAFPAAKIADRQSWLLTASAPIPPTELSHHIAAYKTYADAAAGHRVIESHLRLVAKIARRYAARAVPLDDLMAEGALALQRALDNFDPSRGTSFTSYASVVVEHSVRSALRTHQEHLRVPARERRRSAARQRRENHFFVQHGRWPAAAELHELERAEDDHPAHPDAGNLTSPRSCVSLDADHETGRSGANLLADNAPTPFDHAARRDNAAQVAAALETLPVAVAKVIRLRFGIGGQPPMATADVARALSLAPIAVERALLEGLRRLRSKLALTNPGPAL